MTNEEWDKVRMYPDPWAHLNDPPLNARQRRDEDHRLRYHDAAFDPECFGCRVDYNGPRCGACGEPLYGDLAETARGVIHQPCMMEGEHLA